MARLFAGRTKPRLIGRRIFRKLARAAGVAEEHVPHSLRHTALTRIYRQTKDIHVTARIAGHLDVNTTSVYAHMDLGDLAEMMAGLSL